MRRLFIGLAVLALSGCAAASSVPPLPTPTPTPSAEPTQRIARSVIGQDNVAVTVPAKPNGTLVIAAHGHGGNVDEWQAGDAQAGVRDSLLAAGYSIATSDAGGNVWGAPASVKAYEDLYAWAADQAHTGDVVLLGQSMGGLAALQLVGRIPAKAFVGIYPVCNLASMTDKFPTFRQAWPSGAPKALSPVKPNYPPGFQAIFFSSPADTTVPKATNTDVCAAAARSAGADVTVVPVKGEHGDPSAFQPGRVVEFLDGE